MAGRLSFIDRFMIARALRRWAGLADRAAGLDLHTLRALRASARALRRQLDRVIHTADSRLALPAASSARIPAPLGADWVWRPEPWRGPVSVAGLACVTSGTQVSDGIAIFHDCPMAEISYRQIRNTQPDDSASYGLEIGVYAFRGSFLSLALDLPRDAAEGLRQKHVIRLDAMVEAERPAQILARLNVRHGPNTAQLVGTIATGSGAGVVEFDLAYAGIDEQRVEKLWVDLFVQAPAMNSITLRDVILCRRPRAAI